MIDSDSHNFSKKTYKVNNYFFKPRPLYLEYMVYSSKSKFRHYIQSLFNYELDVLPELNISNNFKVGLEFNKMEAIDVNPINRKMKDLEIEQIGSILGMCNILGITDLHKENIIFGLKNNKIVFAPIDLEMSFQGFCFDTMGIKPNHNKKNIKHSGLDHFNTYLDKFPDKYFTLKLVRGYINFINDTLENITYFYELLFSELSKFDFPIRVVKKKTSEYYKLLKSKEYDFLSECEKIQLDRGDIPYFFTFLNDKSSYQWESDSKYTETKLKPFFNVYLPKKLCKSDMIKSFINIFKYINIDIPEKIIDYKDIIFINNLSRSVFKIEDRAYSIRL